MGKNKNVLLITIDSLRADHVSCLGYHRKTTPHIDNLAETGILFTQAVANGSLTPISFPSLLTSSYPLMYEYHPRLSKWKTTVAEVLRAKGYSTAAFHSNPYLSRYFGYDRGFDTFEDFIFSKLGRRRIKAITVGTEKKANKRLEPLSLPRKAYRFVDKSVNRGLELFKPHYGPYERADIINERSLEWLKQGRNNFFLWIHYMDVHYPYVPRNQHLHQLQVEGIARSQNAKLRRKMARKLLRSAEQVSSGDFQRLVDLCDGEIRYTDDAVGSILTELEQLGVYDDTLIIVTADHGDEFNEHGDFGHRPKLYDELIRVPLIIKCPGMEEGVLIDHQVQHLDIAPTILDFLGIEKPMNFQGTSLISLVEEAGGEDTGAIGVISETVHNKGILPLDGKGKRLTSYRTGGWKYIVDEETGKDELYNLQDDPQEKSNLVDKEPQKIAEYKPIIMKHIQMEEKSKEAIIADERDKVRQKIESLRKARLA